MTTHHRPWRRAAFAAVLLAGTSLGGLALGPVLARADNPTPVNPAAATNPAQPLPDFTHLVGQVKPAVVSITTKMQATPAAMQDDGDDAGPAQGQMPQLPFPFNQMVPHGGGQPRQRAVEARGSGFIIDAGGTVVTNNHVVKGAKSVTVTLDDGTELPAKVLATDPRTDIAVLKVKSDKQLPYIQLGNSRDVKPGEWSSPWAIRSASAER